MDLTDHFGNTISFYDSKDDNSGFQVYQSHANERKLIFEAPFLAQKTNINTAFLYKIERRGDYAIISMNIQPSYNSTGIPYVGNYFINIALRLTNSWYEFDKDISDYLSEGGNIYNLNEIAMD